MKKRLKSNFLYVMAFLIMITLGACSENEKEHAEGEVTYTCPMHPQIVQNEPGTCPICGMDLVPTSGHGEGVEITEDLAFLLKPTTSTVVADISTTKPQQKTVQASVEMEGIITYDPRRIFTIPARIGGRIEQLLVKYNFQPISKGQKLMEIYSPELVTAQKELLYLVQSAPEDKLLIDAAKQKLRLLGATEAQINRLIRTGEESYTFAIYSPYDGYITGLNTTAPTTTPSAPAGAATAPAGGMDAMGTSAGASAAATAAPSSAGQDVQLREGMYISRGQALLSVVNPKQLWAEFNIPAGEISSIAKGAPVQITFPQLPDKKLNAQVDFFQPFYEAGENFAKVRVYLPGEQKLAMVGQLVSGTATYTTAPSLWVPKEAVLDIGTRSVAFKKVDSVFEPVEVTVGTTENGLTQIVEGLQQDDVIAANAQFLVDSESFIKIDK